MRVLCDESNVKLMSRTTAIRPSNSRLYPRIPAYHSHINDPVTNCIPHAIRSLRYFQPMRWPIIFAANIRIVVVVSVLIIISFEAQSLSFDCRINCLVPADSLYCYFFIGARNVSLPVGARNKDGGLLAPVGGSSFRRKS